MQMNLVTVLGLAIYKTNVLNKTTTSLIYSSFLQLASHLSPSSVFILAKHSWVVTHLHHTWMSFIKMCHNKESCLPSYISLPNTLLIGEFDILINTCTNTHYVTLSWILTVALFYSVQCVGNILRRQTRCEVISLFTLERNRLNARWVTFDLITVTFDLITVTFDLITVTYDLISILRRLTRSDGISLFTQERNHLNVR